MLRPQFKQAQTRQSGPINRTIALTVTQGWGVVYPKKRGSFGYGN